jgi:predicted DNA-binding transcriptional regulator AlpA
MNTTLPETRGIEKALLSQKEACQFLGISRSKLCELTYAEEVPSKLIGRRRMYPVQALRLWIEAL